MKKETWWNFHKANILDFHQYNAKSFVVLLTKKNLHSSKSNVSTQTQQVLFKNIQQSYM